MANDATDRLLTGWDEARPDLEVGVLQVTARLSRLGAHLARRQEDVFGRFDLNRGEVGALSALRIAGSPHRLSPTRLAKGLMLSSAGITSRIDRLERRGYVRRLDDPNDRRGVLIELTDEGLEVVDAAVAANTTSERTLLDRLDPDEIASLEGILRKLLAGLELPD
ncbi:MAG TPA: MarR family transcriptional regulator [Candidatus Limnocylindrales bacterium]